MRARRRSQKTAHVPRRKTPYSGLLKSIAQGVTYAGISETKPFSSGT